MATLHSSRAEQQKLKCKVYMIQLNYNIATHHQKWNLNEHSITMEVDVL